MSAFSWQDIGAKIASSAPGVGALIGTLVAGPVVGTAVGGAAGKALQMVASLFGIDSTSVTPEQLGAAIASDPQAILKLRMAEMDHEAEMAKIFLEEEKLAHQATKDYLADVQSARAREIAIVQATGKKDTNLYVLAWTLIGGFFVLTATLMYIPLPADQSGVIFMLFGALSSGFGCVISYFFGSSKGSADKSVLLAQNGKK
jgi:uncharacterized membrane protein